jgi:hypothetical protein
LRSVTEYASIAKFRQIIREELRRHLIRLVRAGRTDVPRSSPELRAYFDHLIEGHTRLFCGRQREIRSISRFLARHDSGYIFVDGFSGFGKTSLLAELVRLNPDFAYHFISQTYKNVGSGFDPTQLDSLLSSLREQLQAGPILGDKTHVGVELKQLLQTSPASGRRVIVLDAVDEVDRNPNFLFGLLPTRLPSGVFVVLSARSQGDRCYLTDIGLELRDVGLRITLGPLDLATVTNLLERAGRRARKQAKQPEFVRKLCEVSGGDPFYLRFLVEDVERGDITAANLESTPSGLSGYLDRQLSMLNRSAHMPQQRDVLGFILAAKGPLSRADLTALVHGLDGINFNDVLSDIHRFLLVRDDTYTFCHERFKNYFSAKLR